MYTIIQIFMI